jgi:DnaJ-class molecular chaperone
MHTQTNTTTIGEILKDKDRCTQCRGKKIVSEKKILEVFLDKGMQDGQRITFAGEGDQMPGIVPGDVIIVVDEREHPTFKRKGDHLFMEQAIPLITALAGGVFVVRHLDDRLLKVTILPGEVIKPGDTKCITGEGMPGYKRPFDKGNLYVKFDLTFPPGNWIADPAQFAALEALLPPRPALPVSAGVLAGAEDVVLSSMDANPPGAGGRGGRGHAHEEHMDEDDEGHGHGGGPGVQCAQQ